MKGNKTNPEQKYVVRSKLLNQNGFLSRASLVAAPTGNVVTKASATKAQPKAVKVKKERTKWSDLTPGQRKVRGWAIAIVIIVIFVTVSFIFFPNKNTSASLKSTGTATSEAAVGDDVTWTATVTNTGKADIKNLEANTDFGGLQLVSIAPKPDKQDIQDIQDFGPLPAGQSITITYHLLAAKTGVANGVLSFSEAGGTNEKGLSPQTIVR